MIARAHRPVPSLNRPLALGLVVGAHLAGVYFVAVHGILRPLLVDPPAPRLQVTLPQDEPEPLPAIRAPQPLEAPLSQGFAGPRDLPVPEFEFPLADAPRDPVVTSTGGEGPPRVVEISPPAAPPTPLTLVQRRVPREFYPAASVRMGEEGVATIRLCVSAAGILQGAPTVVASSGHARLDAAALAWAREGLAFRPATREGMPVDACKSLRVNFVLTP